MAIFLESGGGGGGGVTDHFLLTNIGVNTHVQIDTHLADATIHFTEASIDHTAIANIGTNSHAALDAHLADATIHFTEASIDHGSIAGLADDDHAQYALLAGRAGGQALFGGTAVAELLDLQGSTSADRGNILMRGRVVLDYDWTTDIGSTAVVWSNTIAASGSGIVSMIQIGMNVTVTASTFIQAAIRDISSLEWTVSPGFAVTTLFFAQPRYFTTSAGIAPAQSFIFAAQPTYEAFGSGAVTCNGFRGCSASPILRARNAGDNLTMVNTYGLTFQFLWNTNNAAAIVDAGNAAAVKVLNPQVVLFGASVGTERCTNYYGIDYDNITIATTGERAVVHSSLVASGINFFLKNDGGAVSNFGGANLLNCGVVQHLGDGVPFSASFGAAGGDVLQYWDGVGLIFNPLVGENLGFAFGLDGSKPTYLFEAENFAVSETDYTQIRFGFDRYAFGQTGSIGNQVGLFVAGNRTVDVAGGWSDYLLTQAGNLDIGVFAMSDVAAWTINQISLDNTAGSITSLDTLVIGGMTTSNPGITVTERSALRVSGRLKQRGTVQYPPIAPAALSAGDNDDWAGLLTGSPSNNGRYWARVSGNATTSTLTGIDATAVQDGDSFELTNVSAENIIIENEGTGSTAANRIITGQGGSIAPNFVLSADRSMSLRYDATSSRWRVLTPPGAVAPLSGHWRFSSTTTMADPGSGTFRNNNATLASVTSIAINDISFRGGDASAIIGSLASGDQLYIQNESDASEFMVFDITGTTDNTTWWQIDGTAGSVGNAFSNNAEFNVIAIFA